MPEKAWKALELGLGRGAEVGVDVEAEGAAGPRDGRLVGGAPSKIEKSGCSAVGAVVAVVGEEVGLGVVGRSW